MCADSNFDYSNVSFSIFGPLLPLFSLSIRTKGLTRLVPSSRRASVDCRPGRQTMTSGFLKCWNSEIQPYNSRVVSCHSSKNGGVSLLQETFFTNNNTNNTTNNNVSTYSPNRHDESVYLYEVSQSIIIVFLLARHPI